MAEFISYIKPKISFQTFIYSIEKIVYATKYKKNMNEYSVKQYVMDKVCIYHCTCHWHH